MSDSVVSFAGFNYPRYCVMLPKGRPQGRLDKLRAQGKSVLPFEMTSAYFTNRPGPLTSETKGMTFYLDSDFMPGLRWQWCDKVEGIGRGIDHTGWFSDEYGDGDTIRGIVLRLPQGRGFLAGWSMGESLCSYVETDIIGDEIEAAIHADKLAESVAEDEREHDRQWQLKRRIEEMVSDVAADKSRLDEVLARFALMHDVSYLDREAIEHMLTGANAPGYIEAQIIKAICQILDCDIED